MDKNDISKINEIKARLAKTTPGNWIAKEIPYDGYEDPCITTESGLYIAQTVYDMQSITEIHNVDDDTIFIANSKNDILYLLTLIDKITGKTN